MHIVYTGNFSVDHTTENHVKRSLEFLGHRVTALQENAFSPDAMTGRLRRLITDDRPDLWLFTRTWTGHVTHDHLALLRKAGVPTASYHLDLYWPLARNGGIESDPFWRCDWTFTADGDPRSQEGFKKLGINHRHVLPAVVADEAYLAADVTLTRDVIFLGSGPAYHSEWPYRGELLGWLRKTYGTRFRQYGGRGTPVRGYQANRLYASTRVAVGDSLTLVRDGLRWRGYVSDRRYEAPGRGAFQVFPNVEGLDDGFVDGVNAVLYDFGDFAGLRDRIDYYLTHDEERERIRRAGHEHVKAHHTYTHRLQQALDVLRTEGAIR